MNCANSKTYLMSLDKVAQTIEIRNKSILITGATGLIGSCIIDVLLYANEHYCLNNTIYALGRSAEKMKTRFSYKTNSSLNYIVQDIADSIPFDKKFHYIIHGASNADPQSYAWQPAETLLTNIKGTAKVLD